MLRIKKTNFWSRRFHETAISDFEMVTATTLIFHGYILTSLFFQILSISTTSKRTDLGFSRLSLSCSSSHSVSPWSYLSLDLGPFWTFCTHCLSVTVNRGLDRSLCVYASSTWTRSSWWSLYVRPWLVGDLWDWDKSQLDVILELRK